MPAKHPTDHAIEEPRDPAVEELSFEEAYRELKDVVAQLEGDGLALEASLAVYERGQLLAARCNLRLDHAELRVQQLEHGVRVPLKLDDNSDTQ